MDIIRRLYRAWKKRRLERAEAERYRRRAEDVGWFIAALVCLSVDIHACAPSQSLREAVNAEIARCGAALQLASRINQAAVDEASAECHRRLEELE